MISYARLCYLLQRVIQAVTGLTGRYKSEGAESDAVLDAVRDFVSGGDFEKSAKLFKNKEILILHGPSGCGKTEIAKKLIASSEGCKNRRLIVCSSEERFKSGVCTSLTSLSQKSGCFESLLIVLNEPPGSFLILDDVHDLENFLMAIKFESLSQYENIKFLITTQETYDWQRDEKGWKRFAIHYNVTGYSKEEAEHFLNAGRINIDCITHISNLPVAWRQLKRCWKENQILCLEDFLSSFINQYNAESLSGIEAAINKAFSKNPEMISLLKHLCMYDHKDITTDLLYALAEEWDPNKIDAINAVIAGLMKFSLCEKKSGGSLFYLHQSVHLVIRKMIKPEEEKAILRVAMQAFSRIVPKDGRNHEYGILPSLSQHAIKLHENCKMVNSVKESPFLQLLQAQLCTSIAYCMLTHKRDNQLIFAYLREGYTIFEKIAKIKCLSKTYELENADHYFELLHTPNNLMDDKDYKEYTKTLQVMHRLTEKDFESLFEEKWIKDHQKLKNGHPTVDALSSLQRGDLLGLAKLREIYPLELFTYHLHVFSKAFAYTHDKYGNESDKSYHRKAVKFSKLADGIYRIILERKGVMLMGRLINTRDCLSLQKSDANPLKLETLRGKWKGMRKKRNKVYECGIVRIRDMSKDDFNKLLCMENELEVTGLIIKGNESRKNDLYRNVAVLIKDIETLAGSHPKPAFTLSRTFEKFAKFWLDLSEYKTATEKIVDSMIKYREYCGGDSMPADSHPEIEDNRRGKFDPLYHVLVLCLKKASAIRNNYFTIKDQRYDYLKSLVESRKPLPDIELVNAYLRNVLAAPEQATS